MTNYQKPYYDGSGSLVDLAKSLEGINPKRTASIEDARKFIGTNPHHPAAKKN